MQAQRIRPEEPLREGPRLRLDVVSFAMEVAPHSDSVRADLYFAVAYTSLEFLRARDNYLADYSLTLTITDSATGVTAVDRFLNYNVSEPTAEHSSRMESGMSRADAEQISLPLRAGTPYRLHFAFRDQNSRHEFDTTVSFKTKDFRGNQPTMSDLMLYRTIVHDGRRGNRIVPSIGSDVADLDQPDAGVFAEAYNLPSDSLLGVVVEVLPLPSKNGNRSDEVLGRNTGTLKTPFDPSHPVPIFQNFTFTDLWTGRYLLRMYLLPHASDTSLSGPSQLANRAIASSEKVITASSAHGIPLANADLDEALDQLRLITTGSEWDSLSAAQGTREKREAIVAFWQKRMSSSEEHMRMIEHANRPMQIFYARIAYANEHLASGFQPGWKSDRGRVYLALGTPDNVERHPYEANQKPYEVWEYYAPMHVRYYFVDVYMLGDYRLNGAPPPPGTFVWERND